MRIRTVEPIHEKRHPRRATFKKANAQLGETVEHPVGEHAGRFSHNPERMPPRVPRIVTSGVVHAQMVQWADVHSQWSAEVFRFLIDWPVDLRSQVAFDTRAV